MNLKEMCELIALQSEVTKRILELNEDDTTWTLALEKLFNQETWNLGLQEIKSLIGPDYDGMKILRLMLMGALKSYGIYRNLGIDQQIFIDTFKCFSRFISEHYVSYGTYAFDREWWTTRQLSLQLFRIGELEYELKQNEDDKVVSIHIPSDSILTSDRLRKSYEDAKIFLKRYFPMYEHANMMCQSWLLSPQLGFVLKEPSHILTFQKAFHIETVDLDNMEYRGWVFKKPFTNLNELPEMTSLQRNIKQFLLSGGKIGCGLGFLVDHPFNGGKNG